MALDTIDPLSVAKVTLLEGTVDAVMEMGYTMLMVDSEGKKSEEVMVKVALPVFCTELLVGEMAKESMDPAVAE